MLNDARHALRFLRRSPSFTLTAVLTLAVGIGATTGVYSIYNAVLLKPLPFDHPERVVAVMAQPADGGLYGISGGTLTAVRALPAVGRAAVTIGSEQTLLDAGNPELVRGAFVAGEFFAVFGVPAAIGRVLDVSDPSGPGGPVVLSHRLWQRRFKGDTGVVGRRLRLGEAVREVVGVMPASFRYPEDAEYWAPYTIDVSNLASFGRGPFTGIARLESDDLAAASAQAAVLGPPTAGGTERGTKVVLVPLLESMAGLYRSNLTVLFGAVTMVLLISCLNVANLLLAQATAREQELAIRAAIGATRSRLLRQLVAESAILASGGALTGLLLAQLIVSALPALGTLDIPRLDEATLDWRVLAFAAAAAAGSVCVFGIVPPWLRIRRVAPALGAGRTRGRTAKPGGGPRADRAADCSHARSSRRQRVDADESVSIAQSRLGVRYEATDRHRDSSVAGDAETAGRNRTPRAHRRPVARLQGARIRRRHVACSAGAGACRVRERHNGRRPGPGRTRRSSNARSVARVLSDARGGSA